MSDDVTTAATIASLRAEVERLKADNAFMRGFINNEDVRSDFQTATAMRQALDTARADVVREQRPWTVRLSIATVDGYEVCECTVADIGYADRILLVTCDDVTDMQRALDTARERAGVLEAEVRGLLAVIGTHDIDTLDCDRTDNRYCDCLRKQVDKARNALDAAKFGGAK